MKLKLQKFRSHGLSMLGRLIRMRNEERTERKEKSYAYKFQKTESTFGAITPAPIKQQELFITSNWRIVRPVIDHEKCTRCFTCL